MKEVVATSKTNLMSIGISVFHFFWQPQSKGPTTCNPLMREVPGVPQWLVNSFVVLYLFSADNVQIKRLHAICEIIICVNNAIPKMEICSDREMVSRTINHMTCCSRSAMMRWNVRGSGFRNLLIVCFFFTTALCCACAQLQKVLEEEKGHHLTYDNPRLFVIYAS